MFDAVAGHGPQRLGGTPIGWEEQFDRELGGGHLERGIEGGEHAEEGQLGVGPPSSALCSVAGRPWPAVTSMAVAPPPSMGAL
jgi:hypothetical protein